jgi:hypothetical protein
MTKEISIEYAGTSVEDTYISRWNGLLLGARFIAIPIIRFICWDVVHGQST